MKIELQLRQEVEGVFNTNNVGTVEFDITIGCYLLIYGGKFIDGWCPRGFDAYFTPRDDRMDCPTTLEGMADFIENSMETLVLTDRRPSGDENEYLELVAEYETNIFEEGGRHFNSYVIDPSIYTDGASSEWDCGVDEILESTFGNKEGQRVFAFVKS